MADAQNFGPIDRQLPHLLSGRSGGSSVGKSGIAPHLVGLDRFFGTHLFTVYPVVKIIPSLISEAENIQYHIPKIENYIKHKYLLFTDNIKGYTDYDIGGKYIDEAINYVQTSSTNILLATPKVLALTLEWAFLVPLFLFFFLKDGQTFKRLALKWVPNSLFERTYDLGHQFNTQLGDYIFAKLVEATIVGLIIFLGLSAIGMRFSLLLGILAGVTNIIPYLGPVIGLIPILLLALAEYGSSATTGAIVVLYSIAYAIDIVFVFPILMSKIVNLHPIVVVVSVILGGQAMGVIGMLISIPAAAALKLIFTEIYGELYHARTPGRF